MMELKNNLQLKSALDDYLYILTVDLPPENTLATTMVFSARFSRRMDRLIRAARKLEAKNSSANQPHKSRSGEPMSDQPARRWRKRFVLAAVIIMVVLSTFAAVAAHDRISDFFITIYEKYTSIVFDMNEKPSGVPVVTTAEESEGTVAYNMPTYIPDGYMQTELEMYGGHALVIYTNSSDDDLIFEVNDPDNLQITIDSENTKGESIMIGQLNGFYYDNKGVQNLIWQDPECVYMIMGQIGKEEMIAMAESMY